MDISLKCRCGKFGGVVKDVSPRRGIRVVCLCDDCQAYAHHLGKAKEILDENGGTDIFPVAPASVKITQGLDQLRCLRLSPKGVLRWYTGCCKTAVANTAPSAKMPYNGIVHTILDHAADGATRDQALGPVRARIYGKYGIGELPPGTLEKGSLGFFLGVLRLMVPAFLKKQYRPSPFFDDAGKPTVEPTVLAREERESLRPLCGPRPA